MKSPNRRCMHVATVASTSCSESCDISVASTKSADKWIFDAIVRLTDAKKRDLLKTYVTFPVTVRLENKTKGFLSKKHLTGKMTHLNTVSNEEHQVWTKGGR
jgi:hypothetical protein